MTLLKCRDKTPFHCDSLSASAGDGVSSGFQSICFKWPYQLVGLCGVLAGSWASVCLGLILHDHLQVLHGDSVCSFSVCVFKALLVHGWRDFTLRVITRAFPSYSSFSLSLLKCDPQKTIHNPTQDTLRMPQSCSFPYRGRVIFKQTASLCVTSPVVPCV